MTQLVNPGVENRSRFWTKRRALAAQLVADDELLDAQICQQVGRSPEWLYESKRNPEFQAKVAEIVDQTRKALLEHGIAVKANRMKAKDERWTLLQTVRRERATAAEVQDVPGGKTGLVIHQLRTVGSGHAATIVDEYVIDKGQLDAELALEESAAREMGEVGSKPARGKASLELDDGEGRRAIFTLDLGTDGGGEEE